jgi:outer membrane protein assembly factor BamB
MKPHINLRFSMLFVSIVVAIAVSVRAENWPLARNDVLGTGATKTSIGPNPEVLWKYSAGAENGFEATAVVYDGIIYVADLAGSFHAVRLSDGTQVWKKDFADTGFGAAAAVEKGRLYVGDLNGTIYCLATADGQEFWSNKIEGEIHAGPTLNGDDVLFTCEGGTLSCRNKQDGNERWQFHIEAPLRCTPTISAGRAALAGCDSRLYIVDVADGKEIGAVDIDAPTGSTPAMKNDRVYFGTEGGTFYAISFPAEGGNNPLIAWQYRDPKRNQPIRAAAAVSEQIVVYGGQSKAIYGLLPDTGAEKWKVTTRARVESSPVIAGNDVVAATAGGKIYVIDAASGETKWEFDAGGSFIASPAVVDGKIILGNTDGVLYCFGAKKAKVSSSEKDSATESTEDTEKTKTE